MKLSSAGAAIASLRHVQCGFPQVTDVTAGLAGILVPEM
jgi:hypothetical protein